MKKHLKNNWICKYCGYRDNTQAMEELGYIYDSKCGKVCECPNVECGMEQLLKEK